MKIFGLTREVVNFILKRIETYLPDYHADSFEEYEKKYIEGMLSILEESIPFFNFEEKFKIVLEDKAKEYAEKHFYDVLNCCCFVVQEEDINPHEILNVIHNGDTLNWLKEHKCDSWITEEMKNRYGIGAIQHHAEKILLRYVELALKNNFSSVYVR